MYISKWYKLESHISAGFFFISNKKIYKQFGISSPKDFQKQYKDVKDLFGTICKDLFFLGNGLGKPGFFSAYRDNLMREKNGIKKLKIKSRTRKFFQEKIKKHGFFFAKEVFKYNGLFFLEMWGKKRETLEKKPQWFFLNNRKKFTKFFGKKTFKFSMRKLISMKNEKNFHFRLKNSFKLTNSFENSGKTRCENDSYSLSIIKVKKRFFFSYLFSLYKSFSERSCFSKISQYKLTTFQLENRINFHEKGVFFLCKKPFLISTKFPAINQESCIILIKFSERARFYFLETIQPRKFFRIKSFQNSNGRDFLKTKLLASKRCCFVYIKLGNNFFNFSKTKILKKFLKLFYWRNLWTKIFFLFQKSFFSGKGKFFLKNFQKLQLVPEKRKSFSVKWVFSKPFCTLSERKLGPKIKFLVEKYPDRSIFWIRALALEKIFNIKNVNKIIGLWIQKNYLFQCVKLAYFILNLFELLLGNPCMGIKFSISSQIKEEIPKTFNNLSRKIPSEVEKLFSFHEGNTPVYFDLEAIKNFYSKGFRDLARKLILKTIFYSHGGNSHGSIILFWIRMESENGNTRFSEFLIKSIKPPSPKNHQDRFYFYSKKIKNSQWKTVFLLLKNSYKTRFFQKNLKFIEDTLFNQEDRIIKKR